MVSTNAVASVNGIWTTAAISLPLIETVLMIVAWCLVAVSCNLDRSCVSWTPTINRVLLPSSSVRLLHLFVLKFGLSSSYCVIDPDFEELLRSKFSLRLSCVASFVSCTESLPVIPSFSFSQCDCLIMSPVFKALVRIRVNTKTLIILLLFLKFPSHLRVLSMVTCSYSLHTILH